MEDCKTRSARHHSKQKNKTDNTKKAVSLFGTSLVLMPVVGDIAPVNVLAEESKVEDQSSEQAFINSICDSAAYVAESNNLYASVMIAQALLESSFGDSALASAPNYNLFGVKGSYNGQAVYMPTAEYLEGQWMTVTEPFRSYNSYTESFQDHANVLRTTISSVGDYYYSGAWKSNTTNYMDATAALAGRYATDPHYNYKLNWLIENYGLTAYDWSYSSLVEVANEHTSNSVAEETSSDDNELKTVIVTSGDTLWGIAENYGLTVDQLMLRNGLSTELITVGQTLIVS